MYGLESWKKATEASVAQLRPEHPWAKAYRKARDGGSEAGMSRIAEGVHFFRCGIAGPMVRGPTSEIGAKLLLGIHPKDIVPSLDSDEACRFCAQEEHATPEEWYWTQMLGEYEYLQQSEQVATPRSIAVMKWLRRMLDSPRRRKALIQNRVTYFGEQETEGSILARLDEFIEEDLRDSVSGTLVASVERQVKERWDGPNELIPEPEWEKHLPAGVTLLRHATQLFLEGSEMRHCAANYCKDVAGGKFFMFSIKVGDKDRATLQTSKEGKVLQITSFANKSPSTQTRAVANKIADCILRGPHQEKDQGASKKRRRFTEAQKAEAVKYLKDKGKTLKKAAEELGISASSLSTWANRAEENPVEQPSAR